MMADFIRGTSKGAGRIMDPKEEDDVSRVRTYLDKYEKEDIKRFTAGDVSGAVSHAVSIQALLCLFSHLKRASPFFRLKIIEEGEDARGKIVGAPRILYNFSVKHACADRKAFEERYPCIAQMMAATVREGSL